eukprot:GGOE01009361.1.p4 GENE.GGOE01009361.1~~GGOE01009361.1.p4  ORF type:complete len:199 (-),score=41.40 GGOE01009361.1:1850-2407(-)
MANMSFASVISASSNDGVASMNTSFASANQRTVYVHSPYTFTGPYEMVVPCKEEEEESFGNGSFFPGGSNFNSKPPVCTSHMCNAAFAFHTSSCPLARAQLVPQQLPPMPESPTSFSPTSSVGSLTPEPRSPLSPVSGPMEPIGSPAPIPIPISTPTGILNRHRKMLRALRQDSHQNLLQLRGPQ